MNYNIEYIEKLRIHELRDYARKLGVSRPTTLKKEELLTSIFEIVSQKGLDQEDSPVTKEGLDFFALLTAENSTILEDLLAEEPSKKSRNTMLIKKSPAVTSVNAMEAFSYPVRQNSAEYNTNGVSAVSGFVDIHPNGYGILRIDGFVPSDKDVFFTSLMVKKYNLKKGMFLSGNAKFVIEGKPRVLFEISTIQDKTIMKSADNFDNYEYNGYGEELYLDKHIFDIALGSRHYIEQLSLEDCVKLGYDIVEENAASVKLINFKARPEEQPKSNGKLEIINVPFNKTEVEVLNTVELVLERVKREFEIGKSNVIILYNFCELIRYINTAYEGCYDCNKLNAKTINKINNILYTAKYYNQDKNCSIICADRNGISKDLAAVMEYEFLPLFNKIHTNN